jgi:hypothetical protein
MKNERPDGQTLEQLLERTLGRSLAGGVGAARGGPGGSPVVVGEVLDTHDPQQPDRVFVSWFASADDEQRAWLQHERHLALRPGDWALVTRPLGWAEWVVTGALASTRHDATAVAPGGAARGAAPAQASPAVAAPSPMALRLEPGQPLVIVGAAGEPLLRIHEGPEGPVVEFARDQIELEGRQRLRLSAHVIELAAGPGGVNICTEGDAVLRAKAIRLN